LNKLGGLSGKAALIRKIAVASTLPPLVVDSGNLLFKRKGNLARSRAEISNAETITQSYSAMGYDAVAVSSNDLTAGGEFFNKSAESDFPWISANIFDTSGNILFKPYILKDIGEITVGVVAITAQGNYSNEWAVIKEWQDPLRRQLQELSSRADMVILLSSLSSPDNRSIGQLFPQIDLIITADRRRGNLPPYISGNCLISQTQARGKYLGQLSIDFQQSGRWYSDNSKKIAAIEGRIKSVNSQIGRLQKKSNNQTDPADRLKKLTSAKEDLEHQLAAQKSSRIYSSSDILNTFKANFIPIKLDH